MHDRSHPGDQDAVTSTVVRVGAGSVGSQAGVLGTALAGVLAFALSSGSWEWFSTYIGVTLLTVIFSFATPPGPTPGRRFEWVRHVAAYSLVVGLCAALAAAPAMQRWAWLFPMPGTRATCAHLGGQGQRAVDTCLAATTTRWLPVYALAAALLSALATSLSSRRSAT